MYAVTPPLPEVFVFISVGRMNVNITRFGLFSFVTTQSALWFFHQIFVFRPAVSHYFVFQPHIKVAS